MRLASESNPQEAMPQNGRPSTSARSSGRSRPSETTTAAARGSRGISSTRARSLPRPPGSTASTPPVPISPEATAPTRPSPPSAAATCPRAAASAASCRACSRPCMWRTSTEWPRRASTSRIGGSAFAARPPPAAGLTISRISLGDKTGHYRAATMRRPIAVLAAVAALPLLAGCGGSSKKSQASTAATTTAQRYGCQVVKAPPPKGPQHLTRPATRLDPNKTWLATVDTNCGSFTITLDAKRAPITASSVGALIRRGFYDGLTFHRIVRGFVIQGGDPLGTGEGGPGYQVVEPPPAGIHYTRGTVAMAKTQTDPRGASGSQFFVVTAEDATTSAGL